MRAHHIVFNLIALLIAGFFLIGLLGTLFFILPSTPPDKQGWWYFMICLEAIYVLMLGSGGIANFAKGRLAPWPTGIIIAGYCLSIWLLPLAIWGVFALLSDRKRQRMEAENAEPSAAPKEDLTAPKDKVFPY